MNSAKLEKLIARSRQRRQSPESNTPAAPAPTPSVPKPEPLPDYMILARKWAKENGISLIESMKQVNKNWPECWIAFLQRANPHIEIERPVK